MDASARPVVVGLDWSEESRAAVEYAADLATRRSVPLRLVHAVEPENVEAWSTMGWTPDLDTAVRESGRQLLTETVDRLAASHPDLPVTTSLAGGGSSHVLVEESQRAHTLVLGKRRVTGLAALLLSSTTVHVGRRASCPLIAVPARRADDALRSGVVVGVAGSELSQVTLGYAFEQAAELDEPLVAVHTWSEPLAAEPSMMPLFYTGEGTQSDEQAVLATCLAGWQERYPQVRVEQYVQQCRPVAELVARSARARLLVIGSHGRGGFRRLLGSVSKGVLCSASAPVAMIHLRDAGDRGTAPAPPR